MTPILYPLHTAVFEPILPPGTARAEHEIYQARLVSARKWRRRHRMLRLRVVLFGRRKTRAAQKQGGQAANGLTNKKGRAPAQPLASRHVRGST